MRVKSAKKSRKSSTRKSNSSKSIFENDKKSSEALKDVDLVDIEVISSPSTDGNSGRMELSIASISEKLVAEGFDTIEVVSETEIVKKTPKKASAEEIKELLKRKKTEKRTASNEKSFSIDLTKEIDKKKLPKLATSRSDQKFDDDEEEIEVVYRKSARIELEDPEIQNDIQIPNTEQSDKQGILEVRLGQQSQSVDEQAITGASSRGDIDIDEGQNDRPNLLKNDFNVSTASSSQERNVPPVDPLLKVLMSKVTNSGNKKQPRLAKRENFTSGTVNNRKDLQKPLVKSIKRIKKPKIKSQKLRLDLPGPRASLFVRMTNKKTGRVYRKPIRPRRFPVVPFRTTYPFKSDLNLPKINVSYLSDSQTLVQLSRIHPRIESLSIYRREISRKQFEDEYILVNQIEDPPDSYSFIDDVENERAFKYVCVADGLPLYSFQIYRNRGFRYENIQEPFVFAYQRVSNVVIEIRNFPSFYRKLLVYRKSSAEDEEILIDAIALQGRGRRTIRLVDDPSPVEQVLQYRLIGVDENGIETTIEERPMVSYTARLGRERANIIKMNAKYNSDSNEVDISGEVRVENLFIPSSDSELSNPTETTLQAAGRGQNIVKIQIRRINLKTEEDEIILKEIINPVLSKFDTELRSLNRLTFKFSDSGENALTFNYTPLFDMTDYVYIARAIVYPLGVELRRVSDFEKIPGARAAGRLKYEFDPGLFDHPLNVELGIIPGSVGEKNFEEADLVGQTSRSILRRVKVLQSDIEDSISLEVDVHSDSVFDPVMHLVGKIPDGLLDDLDHVAIQIEYDTIKRKDIIDRLFLKESSFEYYDYSFDDLSCNSVSYSLIGIGKDFRELFKSEPVSMSLKDPKLKLINARKKSYGSYLNNLKESEAKRAQARLRLGGFSRRRSTDNG